MKKLIIILVGALSLSCSKESELRTVSYKAGTNIEGFTLKYIGSNGDTNTMYIMGDKIKVAPMVFRSGQVAWCEIDSPVKTMGKVTLYIDKKYDVVQGLTENLSIRKMIE